MKQKLCVLFLLCLAVALVKSESSIEVDGNGNEYDVKRFNIQGRQLNGPSHCVVSRRRRDTSAYGASSDDAIDGEGQESNANVEESIAEIFTAAPTVAAPTATLAPDTDEDEEDAGGDGDFDQEVDLHDIALAAQYQGGVQSAAVAAAAAENGIVVVHAHDPPKVNGQTHAVFELLPVHPEDGPIDYSSDEPYDYIDDEDILHVNEETNPVTTTAIWSTGEDNDLYDELDVDHTTKKPKKKRPSGLRPTRRPLKNKNKKKKKNASKKKNKNKNSNRPVKRRPSQKRPARRPSKNNNRPLRRRPAQNNANKRVVMKKRNQNRNGFKQHKNNNRRINANLNQQNRNRKKNRPQEDINQGTHTYTNTVTETDDGSDDKDRDVNCIIINKDPITTTTTTTTTPRPFWNILGRDAGLVPASSSHFGNRKRVGIRFVA